VLQGTTGTLMVSVAPENGFSGSLSFACSGLPSGWSCSFAPPSLSGSAPESTKMTVSASNSSQLITMASGLMLALVSPLPLFWFRLSGRSRRARWMVLFVLALGLAGCGTSFKNLQPISYNVTVTASGSSAPTHTQTFVLTVSQ
jgi:trimeric autotransporter adhesin